MDLQLSIEELDTFLEITDKNIEDILNAVSYEYCRLFLEMVAQLVFMDKESWDHDYQYDRISSFLLLCLRKRDYLYYRDRILHELRQDKLPWKRSPYLLNLGENEASILQYLFHNHLPYEPLMCEFSRYLFGINGQPILEFNSNVAQEVRANWENICAIGEQGLLL